MRYRVMTLGTVLLVLSAGLAHAERTLLEEFERAYAKGEWEKAGPLAVAAYRGMSGLPPVEAMERMAVACLNAGDFQWAVHFKANVALDEGRLASVRRAETFAELQEVARLANEHQATSPYALVRCVMAGESGDTLGAVTPLIGQMAGAVPAFRGLAAIAIETYLYPAIENAVRRQDVERMRQLTQVLSPDLAPERHRRALVEGLEKGGNPVGAVERAYRDAFDRGEPGSPLDASGTPELVAQAAEIARRNHVKSDIPIIAAWVRYLDGDTTGAVADLAAVAALPHQEYSSVPNHQRCLAMLLAGRIREQKGDLRGALSWYHRLTWSDFEFHDRSYLGFAGVDGPNPYVHDRFHGLLGAIAQSRVLIAMDRPGPAANELLAQVQMTPDIRGEIAKRPQLGEGWAAVSAALESKLGMPFEQPDSLGYYRDDLVLDAQGKLVPREPGTLVDARVQGGQEARRRIHADVAATAREEQERARVAEAERILAAEEAASSAAARTQAFQFLEKQRNDRCIRCKGSGFLYVPPDVQQGWVYSEVTKTRIDTVEYSSGYTKECHWCNGTGKR